jgi:hypothetical protein
MILKAFLQLNRKKITHLKKWAKELNRLSLEKDIQMANRCMRRCSTSLIMRKIFPLDSELILRPKEEKEEKYISKFPDPRVLTQGVGVREVLKHVNGTKWETGKLGVGIDSDFQRVYPRYVKKDNTVRPTNQQFGSCL